MIYVGIDVAKDKHDCFITNSEGEVLFQVFTIQNNRNGFDDLFSKIQSISSDASNIKVGLEATGHYSYNLLGYLINKGLHTFVINPLHTNLYRKSLSLRKTKTDKVDARTIAMMLMSDVNLKSYSDTSQTVCLQACYHSLSGIGKTCSHASYCFRLRPAFRASLCRKDCFLPSDAPDETVGKRLERPLQPGESS